MQHETVHARPATDNTGATAWSYRVPYCDSIQHAFNSLRWEVFQGRQYVGDRAARSIYALRRSQGETGTHSILDMMYLAAAPGHETVSPLTPAELCATFGSMQPTRDDVQAAQLPEVPEWQGRYVIIYHRGHARELLFWGRSGGAAPTEPAPGGGIFERDVDEATLLTALRARGRAGATLLARDLGADVAVVDSALGGLLEQGRVTTDGETWAEASVAGGAMVTELDQADVLAALADLGRASATLVALRLRAKLADVLAALKAAADAGLVELDEPSRTWVVADRTQASRCSWRPGPGRLAARFALS